MASKRKGKPGVKDWAGWGLVVGCGLIVPAFRWWTVGFAVLVVAGHLVRWLKDRRIGWRQLDDDPFEDVWFDLHRKARTDNRRFYKGEMAPAGKRDFRRRTA